jgi:hypothetical protein
VTGGGGVKAVGAIIVDLIPFDTIDSSRLPYFLTKLF